MSAPRGPGGGGGRGGGSETWHTAFAARRRDARKGQQLLQTIVDRKQQPVLAKESPVFR